MKHPLINKNSKHYDTKEKPAIQLLEEMLSVSAMMGWVEGNIFKYEYRKDHKGQKESDEEKIATFKAYQDVLKRLLHRGFKSHTVAWALKCEEISFEYQ